MKRNTYTKILMTGLTVLGLSACGGSGGGSSAPTYSGLSDLEYKTLNLKAKFTDAEDVPFTYAFKDNYETTSDGTIILMDYRSNEKVQLACREYEGDVFSYYCISMLEDGRAFSHALKIEDDGKIKGNVKYSKTGNASDLADVVFADKADTIVVGTVSTTSEGSNKASFNKIELKQNYNNGLKAELSSKANVNISNQIEAMLTTLRATK